MSGLDHFHERPDWHARAACRGPDVPVDIFFPERGEDTRYPKELCAVCVVQPLCLDAGMREKHGVWGGLSERARRRLRRKLKINPIEDPLDHPDPETDIEEAS